MIDPAHIALASLGVGVVAAIKVPPPRAPLYERYVAFLGASYITALFL